MNLNDIVFLENDKRRKPDLYIINKIDDNDRFFLRLKDGTDFGWYDENQLSLLYKYPENCITVDQLSSLAKKYLNMKDIKNDLHNFPYQQESQDYWSGYRGFILDNDVFNIMIQFQNTHYIECKLNGYRDLSYFYQDIEPTHENIESIFKGFSHRLNKYIDYRKKEIELLTK